MFKTTVDLRERGIDEEQAADLAWRLQAFAEDWNRSEMDVYDEPTLGELEAFQNL